MSFKFEDFEELLEQYDNEIVSYNEGDIAAGTIIDIDSKTVTVDIGGKTVGYIPLSEFAGEKIELNQVVDVYIEKIENKKGELIVSRESARKCQGWSHLKKCLAENKIIEGKILGKVKGGFAIGLGDVIAFLPRSQVDTAVLANIDGFVGKTEQFMVLKIDDVRGNVVVSRRAILEEQRSKEREEILSKIKINDVLKGMVKNITDYGAFVDFGSFDGLLHLTDISWCRVRHPSEVLKVGQEVEVQVIRYDEENKKVSLGMKQLQENPWETIENKYPIHSIVRGKVTNIAQYGVFIEIENGIEGLVHISEMSWLKNNISPSKLLSVGQEVDVMVLDINIEHHRISLGVKQCSKNPWKEFSEKYKVGDVLDGVIKNITEFGLFIEFESGIDGLAHISDLSWEDYDGKETIKNYKKNDKIKVVLLGSDYEQERISLGIKQLANENFKEDVDTKLVKGNKIPCLVRSVKRDFIEVEVELGIKSIIRRNDISSNREEQRTDRFKIGDKFDVNIVNFNNGSGKLVLTLKDVNEVEKNIEQENPDEEFDINQYMNLNTNTTLGSVFGNVFDNINNNNNK
jgi:small subunit ribosomal protein S1